MKGSLYTLLCCAAVLQTPAAAVDPQLSFSTYLGGDGRDAATDVAVGPQGHVYVLGNTAFGSLPGSVPVIKYVPELFFDTSPDVLVAKFAPDLKSIEYVAVFGGSGRDEALDIAVDPQGNPVILVRTEAEDFPTKNPLRTNPQGSSDFAVAKLRADGRELIFSTYLGASEGGGGFGFPGLLGGADLTVDSAGQVYIAGTTFSTTFPVTDGAFQRQPGAGTPNVFVSKLAADGSRFLYSTYLGGAGAEFAQAIAVDAAGNAFIGGTTTSTNFPLVRPLNTQRGPAIGGPVVKQMFLTKLNAAGTALDFSTFLIGGGDFQALVTTPGGGIVMAGQTSGITTTANALARASAGGFVLELNSHLTAVSYSTRFGGSSMPLGIAVDASGNLAVTGNTQPGALVTTHERFASSNLFNAGGQAFAVKLDPARNVLYSVHFGGTSADEGHGVAILPGGDLVLVGRTESFDFPLSGALRNSPISDEAFITRISEVPSTGIPNPPGGPTGVAQRYNDRSAANLPMRFYRVRESQPQ